MNKRNKGGKKNVFLIKIFSQCVLEVSKRQIRVAFKFQPSIVQPVSR